MAETKWRSVSVYETDAMLVPHVLQQKVLVYSSSDTVVPRDEHRTVPVGELADH